MEFNNKLPDWENEGTEPSESRKKTGFELGYKPPAGIFNWFWSKVTKAITELQTKFGSHAENKENPHGVTKSQVGLGNVDNTADVDKPISKAVQEALDLVSGGSTAQLTEFNNHKNNKNNPHGVTKSQVGLGNVDNTADSQKSVAFASEAGVGRKVKNALTMRFNGGSTEGTDLWTYDGSTGKSVNITPDKIGAAKKTHTHGTTEINGLRSEIDRIVAATSTDGVTYTATVDGVTELYNGMEITIIPNMKSTSRTVTLNVNGLGAVNVRQPLSFSTFVATAPDRDYFLYENTPCRLMYHANYTSGGIWLMADKQKTSAQDLYGTVPVESGGTGNTSVDTVPTSGSTKMVTSDGIYESLAKIITIPSFDYSKVNKDEYNYFPFPISLPKEKTTEDILGMLIEVETEGGAKINLQGFAQYDQSNNTIVDLMSFGYDISTYVWQGRIILKKKDGVLLMQITMFTKNMMTGEYNLSVVPTTIAGRIYFM